MFRHQRSLSEAAAAYLASLAVAGRSPETIHTYDCILGRFIKKIGDRPVSRVSSADFHEFFLDLTHLSVAYRSLVGRVIKGFFFWCVGQGIIRHCPIANLCLPQPKPALVQPFRREEIEALLSKANPLEEAAIRLLLDTGMRGGELTALKKSDIDMKNRLIYVRHGKGDKQRILALNPAPKKALQTYLRQAQMVDGAIWPEGFDRPALGRALDRLARRAGICCVFPHRFRHTWAMLALQSGVDVLALRVLGGWTSLEMVERYVLAIEQERAIKVHRQHPT